MIEMEEYTHSYTRKRCVAAVCDICGKVNKCNGEDPKDWARGWHIDKITIERRVGEVYPEYQKVINQSFDCCPDCFEAHILSLLKTGPHTVEEDY